MKYLILTFFFLLILTASGFSQEPDSSNLSGEEIPEGGYFTDINDDDIDLFFDSAQGQLRIDSNYFAPAYDTYLFWDTLKIQPYHFDLSKKTDTVNLILADEGTFYYPPIKGQINSEFGFRHSRYHYGIDIQLSVGDSVHAAFDGMIRITMYHRTYGNVVIVRHYNGLETVYAHLSKSLVKPNQFVRAGDVIGLGGSTGRSTGPHLHFETRYLGNAINPRDLIDFSNFRLKSDTLEISRNNFRYQASIGSAKYYTVKRGDTLSKIASRNGVSVKRLCSLNHITTRTVLRPGRKLRIR